MAAAAKPRSSTRCSSRPAKSPAPAAWPRRTRSSTSRTRRRSARAASSWRWPTAAGRASRSTSLTRPATPTSSAPRSADSRPADIALLHVSATHGIELNTRRMNAAVEGTPPRPRHRHQQDGRRQHRGLRRPRGPDQGDARRRVRAVQPAHRRRPGFQRRRERPAAARAGARRRPGRRGRGRRRADGQDRRGRRDADGALPE